LFGGAEKCCDLELSKAYFLVGRGVGTGIFVQYLYFKLLLKKERDMGSTLLVSAGLGGGLQII